MVIGDYRIGLIELINDKYRQTNKHNLILKIRKALFECLITIVKSPKIKTSNHNKMKR